MAGRRRWVIERLDDVAMMTIVIVLIPVVILVIGAPVGLLAWLVAGIAERW